MDRLVALGVTDEALNPFGYRRTPDATALHWGGDPTLTDDDVATMRARVIAAVETAHGATLRT